MYAITAGGCVIARATKYRKGDKITDHNPKITR
nr:MAG TPA: hypothetical protein [Bacteriophage sp.]